jgi:hypothetical protein
MSLIETPFGIRYTSLATSILIVLVVGVARRRLWLGIFTAMGWGTSFELAFQIVGILAHHEGHWLRELAGESWWLWTVIGWSFCAHLAGVRPHLIGLAAFALLMALWVSQGFWFNYPGQPGPVNWTNEGLNVTTKTALAVAYTLGAIWPGRSGWERISGRWPAKRSRRAGSGQVGDALVIEKVADPRS